MQFEFSLGPKAGKQFHDGILVCIQPVPFHGPIVRFQRSEHYFYKEPTWKALCEIELKPFKKEFCNYETVFDYDNKSKQAAELEAKMAEPTFWNNSERAQGMIGQLKSIRSVIKPLSDSIYTAEQIPEMLELTAGDESLVDEVTREITKLETTIEQLELQALLSGEHDSMGALMSIYARDGGTDANDWAEMLLRMYSQWASKNGYQVELLDRKDDDVAGIQSASIAIRGPMAYGYLKGETGIHRLVRISPFNAEGKRQTSFAAIDVAPELPDDVEIEIDPKDIREDTYCSSGAGGQHVNKTESAVRLTHIPTNTVVACQNERSQHKNRAIAWKLMRAKLARLEEEKREAEDAVKYKNQARTGFGSQIRNYFMHPDQRVKDARTGFGVTQFQPVLDGNIQGFLDAYLRWRVGQEVN